MAELSLPAAVRNVLVRQAGLTLESLLGDPSQQVANSYVSGNPHKWTDPLGLFFTGDRFKSGIIGIGIGFSIATGGTYGIVNAAVDLLTSSTITYNLREEFWDGHVESRKGFKGWNPSLKQTFSQIGKNISETYDAIKRGWRSVKNFFGGC